MIDGERQQSDHSRALEPSLGFAPFPVWLAMRILGLIGSGIMIWWVLSLFFFALSGTGRPPYWVLIIGIITGTSARHINSWEIDVPDFWDSIGSRLASKLCAACGQSVFDKMSPAGFELEAARHSFWPARICYGCGNDLSRSIAADPTSHGG